MTALLVCGPRDWGIDNVTERAGLIDALDDFHVAHGVTRLITGDAKGADAIACAWALHKAVSDSVFLEAYPADWTKGRKAGPMRNARMAVALETFRVSNDHAGHIVAPVYAIVCARTPMTAGTKDMHAKLTGMSHCVIHYVFPNGNGKIARFNA